MLRQGKVNNFLQTTFRFFEDIYQAFMGKNIIVNERKIKPEELKNFEGCFLTGTAAEVTPVSCIESNQFKVSKLILDLNESYQVLVRKKKAA